MKQKNPRHEIRTNALREPVIYASGNVVCVCVCVVLVRSFVLELAMDGSNAHTSVKQSVRAHSALPNKGANVLRHTVHHVVAKP